MSCSYSTRNPNVSNQIRHINTVVSINTVSGNRKSISKKRETMQKVHGHNGNSSLKDDYFGF